MYGLKKPLCTPAVLRPIETPDGLALALPELGAIEVPQNTADSAGDSGMCAEPTRSHWMPNRASNHCMRCFGGFSAFRPSRRRHHCRFCGQLVCLDCLFASAEVYYVEPEARARTDSGSLGASGLYSLDDEARVMMDARARLVVPILRNRAQWGGMGGPRFRACKVCKTCGANYQRLVHALNHRAGEHISAPYVFVDNPYLCERAPPAVRETQPERRALVGQVPSDWTWSTF